ncbi:tRNA (adenosine(37)-N6)-threonylcarbamoyltransferase complex ATPase subunit type 1 TsaE [Microbacterium sp. A93]|uniref:tRNA (adenosine(37)-N6)-threonylcarbamoyltransferase complex ATPase subunit type 1 TsaE n=1 Tax=Microbacterium sp. A93 TaxID=3450716 RepID=UPI003F426DE7
MTGAAGRLPEPVWRVEVTLDGAEATQAWAAQLASVLRAGDLVILTGELGAGKTTFTQGLGAGLGVREGIISPTFVLSRIHPSVRDDDGAGPDLVHVDAYRLGSAGELLDLDLDATVDRSVTVVEWGRGLAEALAGWPDDPEASWLDLELVRAEGGAVAAAGAPPEVGGQAEAGAGVVPFITDFSDEDGTGADEVRTAVLLAYGPRWTGVRVPT